MDANSRIIVAYKILQRVRQNIRNNDGKYSSAMTPNLQSIEDALTQPDCVMDRQPLGAYTPTDNLLAALVEGWKAT